MRTLKKIDSYEPLMPSRSSHSAKPLLILFAVCTFVSAFLLFQVQPLISKAILPWFGGTPAVWTTCMLFFQVVLFGGYLYAHLLTQIKNPRRQTLAHVAMLTLAVVLLPIMPAGEWKPSDSHWPTLRILMLLAVHVGMPYFLLASTGPLLQAWFSRSFPGWSPYRLYALSNVGSLLALLSYPFVFEPALGTRMQGMSWSLAFAAFAIVCSCLAFWVGRRVSSIAPSIPAALSGGDADSADSSSQGVGALLWWLVLPAFGSVMLLATTNHVCQDIASVPFLWVVPLSLYLLTFIICFDSPRWYVRWYVAVLTLIAIATASLLTILRVDGNLPLEAAVYFAVMFFTCLLCHGELVRLKPEPARLTQFYLAISAGGALGGITVAIVCPLVFTSYVEMPLAVLVAFLFAHAIAVRARPAWLTAEPLVGNVLAVLVLSLFVVTLRAQAAALPWHAVESTRNFYGTLYIVETDRDDERARGTVIYHGRIGHGSQFHHSERRATPTMYYSHTSGAGIALEALNERGQPLRVGVIGLGAGTVAAYGRPGDVYRFYEINPQVVDFAHRHFTFLSDSPAETEVVLGDARLTMERESPQQYDLLILDAFSGDAIPAHLLTREAFEIYRKHLAPGGAIVVNISNRHVDLLPVLERAGEHFGWQVVSMYDRPSKEEVSERNVTPSHWVLMTDDDQLLHHDGVLAAKRRERGKVVGVPLWTDDFSNLYQILK